MTKATLLAAVCLIVLVATYASGQSSNAAVSGNVTDTTSASIPGVAIMAENVRTGVVTQTISNEAGLYNFPSLQPGMYRFSADLTGFQKSVYNDVALEISAQVRINFTLQVAGVTQAVEVNAAFDSPLAMTTSSVGGVISGIKVKDLPLPTRNALDLIPTQAGVVGDNFAGSRIGTLNITRDGVNVMDQRINSGINSVIFTSTDLVDEVRVVVSPADAEYGRGSGQVLISTKSGTNEFHGSIFESHRNTVLNANTWFNNLRGNPRNFLIRNQFGGRLGGPIIKNKTFFHFLYDAQRQVTKNTTTNTTFTADARRGFFRFYPGVRNGNANASTPTVDVNGNPVKPASASGELESINIFGRDPARMVMDPSGSIQKMLALMPIPNNFRQNGDGLNTAGYTWSRRATNNRDQYNIRIDHNFNDRHRMNFNWTRQTSFQLNGFLAQPFPDSPGGTQEGDTNFFSLNVTSTLSSRVVNEFHGGASRGRLRFFAPWELSAGKAVMPAAGSETFLVDFLGNTTALTEPIDQGNDPQGRISPLYVWGDNLSWIRGRHTFKAGGEVRAASTNGFNSFDSTPRATIGAGGIAVTGLTAAAIRELGVNEGGAQDLLLNLTGSLANVVQAFNATPGANPVFLAREGKVRAWQEREFSLFFKDDFKVRPSVTLNLGVRYEWYGVPYERNGKAAGLVGGSKGIYGLSGTSFDDLYLPGHLAGTLTKVELVGKHSVNPKTKLYNNDWNNFAPAVGLSWSIPYFGKDKTVLRIGYGIGYERDSLRIVDVVSGDQPGLRSRTVFQTGSYLDMSRIRLPLTSANKPLDVVPVTDRAQTVRAFDSDLRTAYVQNWNVTLQRDLPGQMSLDVRYVGNKGSKLIRGTNINEVNIFESRILEAFRTTQAGGNSQLLDQIFQGLNLGLGNVNGTTVTGSQSVRSNANTRGFLANNNVGAFADFINRTPSFAGTPGELLRRAGLAENTIVGNPQFASNAGNNSGGANLFGNFANSTYHAFQFEVKKRFSAGWTLQSNYAWSKALGEEEGAGQEQLDSYRNGRNRRLDKRILSFHRTHVTRHSGTFELPFGPEKRFLNSSTGLFARTVEKWQLGAILNMLTGQPMTVSAVTSSFNQFTDNTPALVGSLPKNTGQATKVREGVTYFPGLQQKPDPSIANLTREQLLNTRSTMQAIADSSGNIILVNPAPGQIGSLAQRYLQGPGLIQFDINLVKRIRIGESKEFEFRADAISVLNRANFANPTDANLDINSTTFGQITGTNTDIPGNRIIVLNLRINF